MSRRAGAELANAASVYNYFRDHDSVTGRVDRGIDTYACALGNPIRYFDPDGLEVRLTCRNCARDKRRRLSGRLSNSTRRCSLRGRRIVILPGQYLDEETGLYYNYFRDYDPVTGRYLESDPIGLKAGLNTYVYTGANPIRTEDRLGLDGGMCRAAITTAGGLVGGAAGYACGCGVGGIIGGAGGTLVAPGVGTVGGAAGGCGAAGSYAGAFAAAVGATVANTVANLVCDDDDEPDCTTASAFHLARAHITDPEEFKRDYVGSAGGTFDICACKDGTIVLKAVGKCGSPGPGIKTHATWK